MASTEIQYSPPRKRQRMSSPAYDVEEMTGSDFDALDEIEVRHSQKMFTLQQRSQSDERQAQKLRDIEKTLASAGSEGDSRAKAEDPSVQSSPHVSSTSIGAHIGTTSNAHVASLPGFTSARNLPNIAPPDIPSSSPDVPPERDYAAWFESDSNLSMNAGFTSANLLLAKGPGDKDDDFASNLEDNSASQSAFAPDAGVVPVLGFTSAKALSRAEPSINPGTSFSGFQSAKFVEDSFVAPSEVDMSAMSGFTSARTAATTTMSGPSPLLLPSAKGPDKFALSEEALKRAAERLKQWEEDDDENEFGAHDVPETPTRPSIRPVQKPAVTSEEIPRLISRVPTFSKPSVSAVGSTPLTKPKAFKSPLLPSTQKATLSSSNIPRYTNSPLNPNPKRKPLAAYNNANKDFASPAHPVEKPAPPPTPLSASPAIFSTPRKLLGVTPRRSAVSSTPVRKFVTPFKPGLRPGEPGRMQLEQENAKKKATFAAPKIATSPAPRRASNTGVKGKWFDMSRCPVFLLICPG
ncbi:hypothetical protein OE88DRAFT_41546 [Heliocybe sulcata]|uniref:Uncharacterized protein n=1 Tax=Heliocybe sulcata TaxID=5364 RepID=A0A5C3NFF9_9AGAM|nr:hypothetical protein OE88DRAFT_41546 [Heliocybe sulcata]